MPVKIRLARRGRKFSKIYSIVVADGRAPRDGKYIETLGQYDPNTNPATIVLDFDRSLEWLQKGAQPTDTCRAILSYKGVLYKKHLMEGVKKGAFDEAEAEKRFQTWMKEKEGKIQAKVERLQNESEVQKKERMAAETKIKEERAIELEKQRSELVAKEAAEAAGEEAEETVDETPEEAAAEAEAPVDTEVKAEVGEAPAAEASKEEPKAEEVKEEKAEENKEEPKADAPKEEPKAEEVKEEKKEEPKAEEPAAEEKKEEAKADSADEDKKEEEKK